MKKIELKTFQKERSLYNSNDTLIYQCRFEGPEDGESPLKESSNIQVEDSLFSLRYALWHVASLKMNKTTISDKCRAALWYCKDVEINDSILNGVKAVRECLNVSIINSKICSPEFGWKTTNLNLSNSSLISEYAFLDSKKISLDNVTFSGKYSFQYVDGLTIRFSHFKTKDAFWHSKNVVVENSIIDGEYLGWYSENLTLINCTIRGTQPLCYCKGLKLINCDLTGCDLAFEYSEVDADIRGHVVSIKNPVSGSIRYEYCDQLILRDSNRNLCCKISKK